MYFSMNTMKNLLSTTELALFEDARRDNLKDLDRRQARARAERARALRQRYLGQLARRRATPRGDGEDTARRKEAVFAELIGRFEKRLEHIDRLDHRLRDGSDRLIGGRPGPASSRARRGRTPGLQLNAQSRGPGKSKSTRGTRMEETRRAARAVAGDGIPKRAGPARRARTRRQPAPRLAARR
jgi:hypothetical protein